MVRLLQGFQLQLFRKPCFNFSSHWKFSKVYFQTFELCRYNSYCWEQNSGRDILKRGQPVEIVKTMIILLHKWKLVLKLPVLKGDDGCKNCPADWRDRRVCQYLLLIGGVAQNQWTDTSILIFHQYKPTKHETCE